MQRPCLGRCLSFQPPHPHPSRALSSTLPKSLFWVWWERMCEKLSGCSVCNHSICEVPKLLTVLFCFSFTFSLAPFSPSLCIWCLGGWLALFLFLSSSVSAGSSYLFYSDLSLWHLAIEYVFGQEVSGDDLVTFAHRQLLFRWLLLSPAVVNTYKWL